MVRKTDNDALAENLLDRIIDRLACGFIDQWQHVFQKLAVSFRKIPAGERLGCGIHEGDAPLIIGCNHGVSDTFKRRRVPASRSTLFRRVPLIQEV